MLTRLAAALAWFASLEPARLALAVRLVVYVLAGLGVAVSDQVVDSVLLVIAATFALVDVVTTGRVRSSVVPIAKLPPEIVAAAELGPLEGSPAASGPRHRAGE